MNLAQMGQYFFAGNSNPGGRSCILFESLLSSTAQHCHKKNLKPQWSDTLKTFLHEIKLHHHHHEIATPHFCTPLCLTPFKKRKGSKKNYLCHYSYVAFQTT